MGILIWGGVYTSGNLNCNYSFTNTPSSAMYAKTNLYHNDSYSLYVNGSNRFGVLAIKPSQIYNIKNGFHFRILFYPTSTMKSYFCIQLNTSDGGIIEFQTTSSYKYLYTVKTSGESYVLVKSYSEAISLKYHYIDITINDSTVYFYMDNSLKISSAVTLTSYDMVSIRIFDGYASVNNSNRLYNFYIDDLFMHTNSQLYDNVSGYYYLEHQFKYRTYENENNIYSL